MSTQQLIPLKSAEPASPSLMPMRNRLPQRKCACGGRPGLSGECAECRKRKLQRKLTIGPSNDFLEVEADRIAYQVLAAPVQSEVKTAPPHIQRYAGQTSGQMDTAPASVDPVLASSGRPLEPVLRQDMESRFGHDFSRVQVHSGAAAEQSAREVNAHAYTVGHNIVFGSNRFAPATHQGRRLIAHELAHVVQQSGAGELSAHRVTSGLLQRKESVPSALGGQAVGDAVRPEVENLLKTFAAAGSYQAQNAAAMQAVRAIIRAYRMSTQGLRTMRFNPTLNPKNNAETGLIEGKDRASEIEFGPSAFHEGFESLVHVVAHEIEHVRQNLIGGKAGQVKPTYQREKEFEPLSEFLAYNSSVLQVQSVQGTAGRGLLGAMRSGTDERAPSLPPLPPDKLAHEAEMALEAFGKMSSAEQRTLQYRQELAGARDKLFERLKNEAPRPLQPPVKFTPEWSAWYDGLAPTSDPFTIEYQDWQDSLKSPWARVKAIWKQFDAVFKAR